jgi:hypothetical protein
MYNPEDHNLNNYQAESSKLKMTQQFKQASTLSFITDIKITEIST